MREILVVEDEPLIFETFRQAVDLKGRFDIRHAADGESALSALDNYAPDLALIDVMLPKVSGIKVADYAASRNVPVILMSGHPKIIESAQHRFPLLVKPFRVGGLIDRLDELLGEAMHLQEIMQNNIRRGAELVRRTRENLTGDPDPVSQEEAAERWLRFCERSFRDLSFTANR